MRDRYTSVQSAQSKTRPRSLVRSKQASQPASERASQPEKPPKNKCGNPTEATAKAAGNGRKQQETRPQREEKQYPKKEIEAYLLWDIFCSALGILFGRTCRLLYIQCHSPFTDWGETGPETRDLFFLRPCGTEVTRAQAWGFSTTDPSSSASNAASSPGQHHAPREHQSTRALEAGLGRSREACCPQVMRCVYFTRPAMPFPRLLTWLPMRLLFFISLLIHMLPSHMLSLVVAGRW